MKSSLITVRKFVEKHYVLLTYSALLISGFLIFFLRFPNNFLQPNFYAEDGDKFAASLINKGFLSSLLSTFNGYYIFGIFLLEKIGFFVNEVLFKGNFLDLPRSLALTSYLFLAFCATLPFLLVRNLLGYKYTFLFVILCCFVPLLSSDYAIIGTIGNLKFAFTFLAFLLIIYRTTLKLESQQNYLVDLGLLICAYTTVNTYFFIPFILLTFSTTILKERFRAIKTLFTKNSFRSFILLCLLLIPQVIVVLVNGIPKFPGYLDSPFEFSKAVEILLFRPLVFSVFFPISKNLNDILAFTVTLVFFITGLFISKKGTLKYHLFGYYAIGITTLLFVANRTGVSIFFSNYKSSGPDQFFYPQNLIFFFVFALFLKNLLETRLLTKYQNYLFGIVLSIVIVFLIPNSGSFGKNNFMEKTIGSIYQNAKIACKSNIDSQLQVPIYPIPGIFVTAERSKICN